MRQFGYRRLEGLYTILLGEAHLLHGDPETAVMLHCTEAHHLFTDLDAPIYVQRTLQQAYVLGLTFTTPATASAT